MHVDRHRHTPAEESRIREATLDHTIEDSFPASDPPSAIPNPDADELSLTEADMSEPYAGLPPTRPHPSALAGPYLEADLTREIDQLHEEAQWSNGHNAKTLVKYDDFRIVLTALKARARLPQHQTKGRLSIQTVAGHILVRAEGRTFDLPTGTLLALDQNLPHDVEALEESAFLITIAWPPEPRRARTPAAG